jgi:hypothetical protein
MAAELLGGATPFGWAQLGVSMMGQAARPAGPSSADALFGSSMLTPDHSGWLINFGDNSNPNLENSNRGAPSMTPVSTAAPGGYAPPVVAPGNTPAAAAGVLGNTIGGLPWIYIIGGAALLLVIWKKA